MYLILNIYIFYPIVCDHFLLSPPTGTGTKNIDVSGCHFRLKVLEKNPRKIALKTFLPSEAHMPKLKSKWA